MRAGCSSSLFSPGVPARLPAPTNVARMQRSFTVTKCPAGGVYITQGKMDAYRNEMACIGTVSFDTSAINAIEDLGNASDGLLASMATRFRVVLPGLAIEEILSTSHSKKERREALLARSEKLLKMGTCLWPPHEILTRLVVAHAADAAQFRWPAVDVRARAYEWGLAARAHTEELCQEQLTQQREVQDGYEEWFRPIRAELEKARATNSADWPDTFEQFLPHLRNEDQGLLWRLGSAFYERVGGRDLNLSETRRFMDECPPFRVAIYGICLSLYDRCVRPLITRQTYGAGRNDILMCTYLPYCNYFATADAAQRRALSAATRAAGVPCEVLAFSDFSTSMVQLHRAP